MGQALILILRSACTEQPQTSKILNVETLGREGLHHVEVKHRRLRRVGNRSKTFVVIRTVCSDVAGASGDGGLCEDEENEAGDNYSNRTEGGDW